MNKSTFIFINLISSPILALIFYPFLAFLSVIFDSDSVWFGVIFPVFASSIIISTFLIIFIKLRDKSANLIMWFKLALVASIISASISPITLGLIGMGSYLIYCKFGSC